MPKGRPALRVATASAALRPQRKSHWLRAAPCIRLSHTMHLAMKVRQAASQAATRYDHAPV